MVKIKIQTHDLNGRQVGQIVDLETLDSPTHCCRRNRLTVPVMFTLPLLSADEQHEPAENAPDEIALPHTADKLRSVIRVDELRAPVMTFRLAEREVLANVLRAADVRALLKVAREVDAPRAGHFQVAQLMI